MVREQTANGSLDFKRRCPEYDPSLIGSPDNDLSFINSMCNIPVVPFEVDSSSHCHIVDQHIYDSLKFAYPIKRRRCGRVNLEYSSITVESIIQRRCALKQYRQYFRRFTVTVVYKLFRVWHASSICRRWKKFEYSLVYGFNSRSNLLLYYIAFALNIRGLRKIGGFCVYPNPQFCYQLKRIFSK